MLTQGTAWTEARARLEREVITTQGIAGRLELRLHWPAVDEERLLRGCEYAADVGLASVLCRPEHVGPAATRLAGTATVAVTALAFHDTTQQPHTPADLAAEAAELVSAGASEVALIAAPGLEDGGSLNLLREQVGAVVETVTPQGSSLRVLLNTTGISNAQVRDYTTVAGEGGASLVQGGSFRGDRATVTELQSMREALPRGVLLKWTQPVRSVERMLVAMAMGVDRFNGDIPALLSSAGLSSQTRRLMLPIHGVDF